MSRAADATEAQIRRAFELAMAGREPVSDTGLDDELWDAILIYRQSLQAPLLAPQGPQGEPTGQPPPLTPEQAEAAARALLEAQLDGTLERVREAEHAASFAAKVERLGLAP